MNKRERVITALEHKDTDFVPYHLRFTKPERRAFAEFTGVSDPETHFGNHIDIAYSTDFMTEPEPGMFKDEFGVVWDRRDGADIGMPEPVLKGPSFDGYVFPGPVENEIAAQLENFKSAPWDTFRMVAVGFTFYERAWSMRGLEATLEDMLLEEDFFTELLDRIVDYNIAVMDSVRKHCDDFDAFYFGDDWGSQRGLVMGAPLWRKLIRPGMAKLIGHAKKCGKYTFLHSCGDIYEIFPDLIEIGLDVYDTFQPEVYPIREVKEKYGDKLSFLGGISIQALLPFASPEVVESTTKEIMEIMGKSGGFIAAPTHDMTPDIPAENVEAMIRAFQNQRS